MRANKAGYRAALANHAFAYHAGSASFTLLELDLHDHRNSNLQKIIGDSESFKYIEIIPEQKRVQKVK